MRDIAGGCLQRTRCDFDVLSPPRRLTARVDFTRTLQHGVRVKSRDMVVSVLFSPPYWPDSSGARTDVAVWGGPRFGFVVSKSVGNSVVRHTVTRRLRAACAGVMSDGETVGLDTDATVVIRALPGSRERSSTELCDQLMRTLVKAERQRVAGAV